MELSRAPEEARLAACAQVADRIPSAYWCDNAVQQEEEWLVLLDAKRPAQGADR